MAPIASFDVSVQPHQGIARLVVIEQLWIPTYQSKVFPLVLMMALETVVGFLAVEASLCTDPHRELFVAGETFIRCETGLRRVASGTVLETGKLRMRSVERARGHEEIELLTRAHRRRSQDRYASQEPPARHHWVPKPR
jgi:hypothetical protein